MVFEGIAADIVNRAVGDYVENLDPSQLEVGIFAGDLVLRDIVLKQSALDVLDLPMKAVYGYIGKAVLKVQWFNLYNAPIIAKIERLFLLVVPKQEPNYDAEEEEKRKQEAKQAELQRIEESEKLQKDKDTAKQPETLIDKLMALIIKCKEVCFRDVHIRYEDTYTCPRRPFSVGLTLHSLSIRDTDSRWQERTVEDDSPISYKVLEMDCLAMYWNCNSRTFPQSWGGTGALMKEFLNGICTMNRTPRGFRYVLGPMNTSTKLHINPQARQDGFFFNSSKLLLDSALGKLPLAFTMDQFRDAMELLEDVSRRKRAAYYRKYRPLFSSSHGRYKQWWKFAYTCVIQEVVQRQRCNWSWQHMKAHRRVCRDYGEAYRAKLRLRTTKGASLPRDQQELLDRCERELDLTNIVIIRQKVELQEEWILAAKQQARQEHSVGWFFNGLQWWVTEEQEAAAEASILGMNFGDIMTPEEKAKLCRMVDFQEDTAPPEYPSELAEVHAQLMLDRLQVQVRGGAHSRPRLSLDGLELLSASFTSRPAPSGFSQKQRR